MTDDMIQILNLLSQGANSSSSNVVQYSSDTALVNYKHKRSIGNSIQFNIIYIAPNPNSSCFKVHNMYVR